MRNKNLVFIIIAVVVLAIATVVTRVWPEVQNVKSNIEQKQQAEQNLQTAKVNLENAKRAHKAWEKEQEQKKEQAKINQGKYKAVYEPKFVFPFVGSDKSALFGVMLEDVVKIARQNKLKIHSIDYYEEVKLEPLLEGRQIAVDEELKTLGAVSGNDSTPQPSPSPNGAPAENGESAPAAPAVLDYKGYQVDFGFIGTYSALNRFLTDVTDYKYLIKVKKFESYPYKENPKYLVSHVSLVFFVKHKG